MLKMKLRGKTLLVMLLVAVVPLSFSMIFLSNFTNNQIRSSMTQYAEKSSNFVARSTTSSQQELSNYLRLLSSSSDIVNALYYASLTGDIDQLREPIEADRAQYSMDILEVLAADGTSLFRVHNEGLSLPEQSETVHPLLVAAREKGKLQAALSTYLGKLTILVANPVRLQDNIVGFLVGAYLLDDEFALYVKQMGGVEVAFLGEEGVVGASHPDFYGMDLSKQKSEILLNTKPYLPITRILTGTTFSLVIAQDLAEALLAQQSLRNLMGLLIVAVIAIVLIAAFLFSRALTKPLLQVVDNLKEISQGEADLTRTLVVNSNDEVGELAENFNTFVARLREMVHRMRSAGDDISVAT